jgi:hypothetical protein
MQSILNIWHNLLTQETGCLEKKKKKNLILSKHDEYKVNCETIIFIKMRKTRVI